MALHEKSSHHSSLCNLGVLCASVVEDCLGKTTTETQRTQRLHREIRLFVQSQQKRASSTRGTHDRSQKPKAWLGSQALKVGARHSASTVTVLTPATNTDCAHFT